MDQIPLIFKKKKVQNQPLVGFAVHKIFRLNMRTKYRSSLKVSLYGLLCSAPRPDPSAEGTATFHCMLLHLQPWSIYRDKYWGFTCLFRAQFKEHKNENMVKATQLLREAEE